jgi:hypothetical protein
LDEVYAGAFDWVGGKKRALFSRFLNKIFKRWRHFPSQEIQSKNPEILSKISKKNLREIPLKFNKKNNSN